VTLSDCDCKPTSPWATTGLTGSSKRTLQGNSVGFDTLDSLVGNDSLSILQNRCNIDLLPDNWDLGSLED
jgi:hypothetical protein